MDTLVLGVGNPILSDDGVGIRIARRLKEENPELEVLESGEAGVGLLDVVVGYRRLIVIDSIKTGRGKPGELYQLSLEELKPAGGLASSHGVGLATALELGRRLGWPVPRCVRIYAVEVRDNTTFGEECTPEVAAKIRDIAQEIAEEEGLTRPEAKPNGFGI